MIYWIIKWLNVFVCFSLYLILFSFNVKQTWLTLFKLLIIFVEQKKNNLAAVNACLVTVVWEHWQILNNRRVIDWYIVCRMILLCTYLCASIYCKTSLKQMLCRCLDVFNSNQWPSDSKRQLRDQLAFSILNNIWYNCQIHSPWIPMAKKTTIKRSSHAP